LLLLLAQPPELLETRTRVKAPPQRTRERLALMRVRRCERLGLGRSLWFLLFMVGRACSSAGARVRGFAFRALPMRRRERAVRCERRGGRAAGVSAANRMPEERSDGGIAPGGHRRRGTATPRQREEERSDEEHHNARSVAGTRRARPERSAGSTAYRLVSLVYLWSFISGWTWRRMQRQTGIHHADNGHENLRSLLSSLGHTAARERTLVCARATSHASGMQRTPREGRAPD
jgi:hypothetical protein